MKPTALILPLSLAVARQTAGLKCIPCVQRHGKIKRGTAARRASSRSHPCPSTCKGYGRVPGYVIDHGKPLRRGGADALSNMQWQTKEPAKATDVEDQCESHD